MEHGHPRRVKDTQVITTQLVLPNDTNHLGNLLGGILMHWLDITAGIAAQRATGRICVTASVDELNFHLPVHLGDIVTLMASVNRVFNTSMEVGVLVLASSRDSTEVRRANNAYLTFVAVDEHGNPVAVPPVVPESTDELRRYEEALARRQMRLKNREKK